MLKEYSDADIVLLNVHEADLLMGTQDSSLFGEAKRNAFVDPRTIEKYASGHIPGAISLPYRQIAEDWENLQEYGVVIVYGNSYNDPLAEAMSKTLMEYGIDEVRTLRGGLKPGSMRASRSPRAASPEVGSNARVDRNHSTRSAVYGSARSDRCLSDPIEDAAVLIEAGPANTIQHLESALAVHGMRVEDLDACCVTHIHLDHAARRGISLVAAFPSMSMHSSQASARSFETAGQPHNASTESA